MYRIDTEGKKDNYPSVDLLQGRYFMHIRAVEGKTPSTVNTSVARTRRYLTGREVEKLMEAARKHGRYGHRDATMILLAYRHGLRACELCDLQWHQVEINTGRLHVRRSKKGTPSVHPMQGDEIRALRRLQREQRHRHTCSPVSAADRCRPRASARYSSASASAPACPSRSSRTCCGTPVATPWPMPGTIRGRCKHGSATRTSSTRSGTPNWPRHGSKTSGAIRQPFPLIVYDASFPGRITRLRFRRFQVCPKDLPAASRAS